VAGGGVEPPTSRFQAPHGLCSALSATRSTGPAASGCVAARLAESAQQDGFDYRTVRWPCGEEPTPGSAPPSSTDSPSPA